MTIPFRYFPYLVQQMIMRHMDFLDVFSLYSTSQKSQALAKSYFNRLDCRLSCHMGSIKQITIKRNDSSENYSWDKDQLEIEPIMQNRKRVLNFCRSRSSVQIAVKNSGNVYEGVLRFVQELFPKLVVSYSFCALTLKDFRRVIKFTENLNVPIKTVNWHNKNRINHSLMKAFLTECSDVKTLEIFGSSPRFQYDFQTNPPFKFDLFQSDGAEWVTKDHLINLFMGCKKVLLSAPSGIHYNGQELVEICKKWLEAPDTQHLELWRAQNFSEGIGELPGAVELRGLVLKNDYLEFDRKKCYKVKKADGTPAIIYHDYDGDIVLRTEFEFAVREGDEIPEELFERLGWEVRVF